MKKLLVSILSLALLVVTVAGCGKKAPDTNIVIAGMKGPTAMGLVKLMSDSESGMTLTNHYNFVIEGSPDAVTPKLISGEVDIASVPANLASVLYNKTEGKICVLAVNTLGVLYVVENGNSVNEVTDLKGKTIYTSGKGSTPEYALNYVLTENGLDPEKDVTIEYKSEHAECLMALNENKDAVAMLPQPFATTALMGNEEMRIALDINQEWNEAAKANGSDASFLTGVVVANKEFVENNPEAVALFMEQYSKSVDFTNNSISEAADLIEKYDIIKAAVAKKAIPYCNITFIAGEDMKAALGGYLENLYNYNPASVGGALPNEDFYYNK